MVREHRDLAAAGGTFGEFGIGLQIIIQLSRTAKLIAGLARGALVAFGVGAGVKGCLAH